jgi:ADP-ribose pyrophosphatase
MGFTGRAFAVRVDDVRLPNGRESVREVVVHKGSVCIVPTDGETVYFVRQYRHATGETLLELPAGGLNPGEEPEACARREIQEEIGLAARDMTLLFEGYVSPGYTSELMRFFLAENLSPSVADADDDEFIDVVSMSWPDAVAAAERGEFRDNKTVAGLFAAARRLKRLS